MSGRSSVAPLLLSVLLVVPACDRGGAPPRLEVFQAEYGAGSSAALVEATFQVRNAGTRELHLRAVVDDCACHAAIVGADVLASNERASVAARCRTVAGASDVRRLRLHSNDPEHATSLLEVRVPGGASVARPPSVSFGYVGVGREVAREIVVPGASPILRLGPDAEAFSLVPGPPSADGSRTYRVGFTPRQPGVTRTTLERGAGAPSIAVSGVGFAALVPYPAEVRTPSAVAADLPPLVLKNMTDTPIDIARIDFPSDITGEVQTIVAGEEFRVRLRSLRPRGGAQESGAIVVHSTAAAASRLVIPVIRVPGA